ncbi:MAG: DUF6777 domain-containing protein [Armatimonadota bacterium]
MKIKYVFTLPILVSLLFASTAVFAAQKTPPGSFLKWRASTVEELVSQVRKDPTVQARFANHYGKPADLIASNLEQTLTLVTLKQPTTVTAWYVSKNNTVKSKKKVLPKGTLVFADQNGNPVLEWSCGNPLGKSLPEEVVIETKGIEEEVLPIGPEVVAATAVVAPPGLIESIPALATEPIVAAPLAGEIIAPAVTAFPPLAIGGLLGGLLAFAGSAGGGGGTTLTVIPEPSSMLALLTGLTAIPIIRKYRKNK